MQRNANEDPEPRPDSTQATSTYYREQVGGTENGNNLNSSTATDTLWKAVMGNCALQLMSQSTN